jgi:hypothetical protein
MAGQWYYARGGERIGPVTTDELKRLAASGELLPTDLVWKEGMQAWIPAEKIKGLIPKPPAQPASEPPPLPPSGAFDFDNDESDESDESPEWSRTERTATNPTLWWSKAGMIASIVAGVICLISIYGAIFCLPFFSLSGLIYFLAIMPGRLHGRWVSSDGSSGWVEFLSGGVFKQQDGAVGTYTLLPNQKFIDIRVSGRLTSWKILSWSGGILEIQDATGVVKSFKKGKTLAEKQASLFYTDRSRYLQRKWEPVNEDGPAIQFTEDGAMIRFDGFAARYTFSGEEPNETITIHIDGERVIVLKVLTLGRDEMVLSGEGGTRHYRRGTSITDAEAQKRADAAKEQLKKIGKAVLLTAGVIGAGIAVLGVAAAATASTTCPRCGFTRMGLHTNCPNCMY